MSLLVLSIVFVERVYVRHIYMSRSALSVVFVKRIHELLGQIDGLRRTHIYGGSPQGIKIFVMAYIKI